MKASSIAIAAFASALILFMGFVVATTLESAPHNFVGKETFDTFEEAQQFQTEVVTEAERVGASVPRFELSITSPSKVTFQILMPSEEEFAYGERSMSFATALVLQVIMAIVFTALTVAYWVGLPRDKGEQK